MDPDTERIRMEASLQQIVFEEQHKMKQLGFVETFIPSADSQAKCSIFMSANWHICRRLLIIIVSGNGIQPGIWSRSLVLEAQQVPNQYQYRAGSMLPYVHSALSKGYGVIVTNPSTNTISIGNEKIPIPCSSTPEMHVRFVWESYGLRASCSQVYIAAYGRGGVLAKHLVCTQPMLRAKLAAIAFIESSHRIESSDSEEVRTLLSTRAINWQRSKESPGTQLQDCAQLGCLSLSAGEPQGFARQRSSNTAWTISASMDTVFAFFESARSSMPEGDLSMEEELLMLAFHGQEGHHAQHQAQQHQAQQHQQPRGYGKYHAYMSNRQMEHQEDAEMMIDYSASSASATSARNQQMTASSRRSMVISTSMSVNDFDLLSVVGKGAYGKVFLARKKEGKNAGRIYAMKVLRKRDIFKRKQVEHTKSEQRILKHIEHPFIVRLRYAFQNEHKLYLVMDYYAGGSLFIHLRKNKRFHEEKAKFYAAELLLAIAHLHANHIMYRDLKLENILMDEEGHIAITDFGLSKEDDHGTTFVGTPEYLAPELLCSQRQGGESVAYGKSVDWWSFGILIYEMICGQTPFYDKNRRQMFQNILSKEPEYKEEFFSNCAIDLLRRLLIKNPRKRLGCTGTETGGGGPGGGGGGNGALEIMQHEWFRGIEWDALLQRQLDPPFKPISDPNSSDKLEYVPNMFKQQDVTDSPYNSNNMLGGSASSFSLHGNMHFEDFSYMGSDVMGSRRTSVFRESDIRMELGESYD